MAALVYFSLPGNPTNNVVEGREWPPSYTMSHEVLEALELWKAVNGRPRILRIANRAA